jgi:DNA-binding response OmpR family regulator
MKKHQPPNAMTMKPASINDPDKKKKRDTPVPAAAASARKRKVLLVDDNPQIRQSLRKVLREEGYEVELAADGREGLEKFHAGRFDMMLLDISLPDMSGWDVFGTATAVNPFVPVIIITGRNEQYDLVLLSGAGALIEKPLDVPKLLQIMADVFAESSETHLKRLVGLHNNLHHVPPAYANLEKEKAFTLRNK